MHEDTRLRNSHQVTKKWEKIKNAIRAKTNRMAGETLFERSSFDARKKQEVSRIVDLSKGL